MHTSVLNDVTNARLHEVAKLVNAQTLLSTLWDENSRPSLRWLRQQQKSKSVPFIKIGALVFFNPDDVRNALAKRHTILAKGAVR